MLLKKLQKKHKINIQNWIVNNVQYLTLMGSTIHGTKTDDSDIDVYGFCIPPKQVIFPHLAGEIQGFSRHCRRFEQWQTNEIQSGNNVYDITIYNIVKYFRLCADGNPTLINSLFTSRQHVIHCTQVGEIVRENKSIFLHKKLYRTFIGYAYSQLAKINTKEPTGKRKELIEKFGYDVKSAYHLVRLVSQCEQILLEGYLDIYDTARQKHMSSIRRGEVTKEEVIKWFNTKEKQLVDIYNNSRLPSGPDEEKIKSILLQCLEHHYGSLNKCIHQNKQLDLIVDDIKQVLQKYL